MSFGDEDSNPPVTTTGTLCSGSIPLDVDAASSKSPLAILSPPGLSPKLSSGNSLTSVPVRIVGVAVPLSGLENWFNEVSEVFCEAAAELFSLNNFVNELTGCLAGSAAPGAGATYVSIFFLGVLR